jgi:DNA-binding transcriptional MerR regulator
VTIGDVISLLRPEFPDVTVSKIRFLEDQGLIEPDRTPSGYRKFGRAHVERLRAVLTLQRDHYLPLRVIRDVLSAGDVRHALSAVPGDVERGGPDGGAPGHAGRRAPRRDSGWLAETAGVELGLLDELAEHGLLDLTRDGRFDADDAEAVRAAAALAQFGLRPRHLRPVRAAAEREADLIAAATAPLAAGRGTEERVADARREMAAALLRLHAALVVTRLR